jgi:hypothetical protein
MVVKSDEKYAGNSVLISLNAWKYGFSLDLIAVSNAVECKLARTTTCDAILCKLENLSISDFWREVDFESSYSRYRQEVMIGSKSYELSSWTDAIVLKFSAEQFTSLFAQSCGKSDFTFESYGIECGVGFNCLPVLLWK